MSNPLNFPGGGADAHQVVSPTLRPSDAARIYETSPLDRDWFPEFNPNRLTPRRELIHPAVVVLLENRGLTSQPADIAEKWAAEDAQIPASAEKLTAHIEFWSTRLHWKSSIAAKLRSVGMPEGADKLDHCRSEAAVRRCTGCGRQTVFWNRCDQSICPCCQPRLAREKKESVNAWCQYIGQPKHVVLTCRNTGELTKDRVKWFKNCFARLRRTKFCTEHTEEAYACDLGTRREIRRYSHKWYGGFYALEVTKSGNGWHLHLHALVDARFIDSVMLAAQWARIIGQDIAIVKVKDGRAGEYLQELLKYVVKGDMLAAWPAADIATLIRAFDGVRTFGVFGTLYKQRGEFASALAALQQETEKCECGCSQWEILSPSEAEWKELTSGIPPPDQRHHKSKDCQRYMDLLPSANVRNAIAR